MMRPTSSRQEAAKKSLSPFHRSSHSVRPPLPTNDKLTITVSAAHNLPPLSGTHTPPDTYVLFHLIEGEDGSGKRSAKRSANQQYKLKCPPHWRTKKQFKSCAPTYSQRYEVLLESGEGKGCKSYHDPQLEVTLVSNSDDKNTEELLGTTTIQLSKFLNWTQNPSKNNAKSGEDECLKNLSFPLYPTKSFVDSEQVVKGMDGQPSKLLLEFRADSTINDAKKFPVRKVRPMSTPPIRKDGAGGANVTGAVFNSILDPQQRDFSSGLRDYMILEPTIEQTRMIDPMEGVERAKRRYQERTSPTAKAPSPTQPPTRGQSPTTATTTTTRTSPPQPAQNLSSHLVRAFSLMSANRKDRKHIRLQQLVDFGRFFGLAWDHNMAALKNQLVKCNASLSHKGVEFRDVRSVDIGMFIGFCSGEFERRLEASDFQQLYENCISYITSSDVIKSKLMDVTKVVRESNDDDSLASIDYLQLFHLGRCLRPSFTWEDCNDLKLLISRCENDKHCREKVLLGVMAGLVGEESDDVVSGRVGDFFCVVEELEKSQRRRTNPKKDVRHSVPVQQIIVVKPSPEQQKKPPPPPPPTAPQQLQQNGRHPRTPLISPPPPPKASSKIVHLIRAVFRVLEKDLNNNVHPKLICHFGQFMLNDWVVTANSDGTYTCDGDPLASSVSQHEFTQFCGRRLSSMNDELVSSLGKSFLASNRSSAWRKQILNGVFRIMTSGDSNAGKISEEELLTFGKCLDRRFSIEDNRRCLSRLKECATKNIRRSIFEGLFSLYCEAFGLDDGSLRWSVEKFIKSSESKDNNSTAANINNSNSNSNSNDNNNNDDNNNNNNNRTASFALLKMDIAQYQQQQQDEFGDDTASLISSIHANNYTNNNFTNINNTDISTASTLADTNTELMTTPSDSSTRAPPDDSDIGSFIERAKRAKQLAKKMRHRDENLRRGRIVEVSDVMTADPNITLLRASGVKKKKPYKRYDDVANNTTVTPTKSNTTSSRHNGVHIYRDTFLHRAAATMIQSVFRRRQHRNTLREQREIVAEELLQNKTNQSFLLAEDLASSEEEQQQPQLLLEQQQQPQSEPRQISNPTQESSNSTEALLALALQIQQQQIEQQKQMQLQQQQQIQPANQQAFFADFLQKLQQQQQQEREREGEQNQLARIEINTQSEEEAKERKKLEEELVRSRALLEEKEKKLNEAESFKKQATAHLRAQNLTIKRLSYGGRQNLPTQESHYKHKSVDSSIKYPTTLEEAEANYDYYENRNNDKNRGERKSEVLTNTVAKRGGGSMVGAGNPRWRR